MIPPPLAPPTLLLENAIIANRSPEHEHSLTVAVAVIHDAHVLLQPLAPIALLPVERTHPVLKQIAPVLKEMARVLK